MKDKKVHFARGQTGACGAHGVYDPTPLTRVHADVTCSRCKRSALYRNTLNGEWPSDSGVHGWAL